MATMKQKIDGGMILRPFPPDNASTPGTAPFRPNDKFGGGIDDISHSLKGASVVQDPHKDGRRETDT